MQTLRVRDGEIGYVDHGDGPAVLLIHAGVFSDWFVPIAASPTLDGHRVVRVRRAGYGQGTTPTGILTMAQHAEHCAQLLDTLGVQAHVVAHSSSALIALELAAARPELVKSLVLYEPPLTGALLTAEEAQQIATLFAPVVEAIQSGDVDVALHVFMSAVCGLDYREVIDKTLGPDAFEHMRAENAFFFTNEMPAGLGWSFTADDAARIKQQALVLAGADSIQTVRDVTARLAHWLAHGEFGTVDHADHMLPLRDPEALAAVTVSFVARIEGQRLPS